MNELMDKPAYIQIPEFSELICEVCYEDNCENKDECDGGTDE